MPAVEPASDGSASAEVSAAAAAEPQAASRVTPAARLEPIIEDTDALSREAVPKVELASMGAAHVEPVSEPKAAGAAGAAGRVDPSVVVAAALALVVLLGTLAYCTMSCGRKRAPLAHSASPDIVQLATPQVSVTVSTV